MPFDILVLSCLVYVAFLFLIAFLGFGIMYVVLLNKNKQQE